jgi:hypothetical protein
MVFAERQFGDFLKSREVVSAILKDEGSKKRRLAFEEAVVMQATSHLLQASETFFGYEVSRMTGIPAGVLYPLLRRFEEKYHLVESELEDIDESKAGRRKRRYYRPTPFGEAVFAVFQHDPDEVRRGVLDNPPGTKQS